jgi:hypothetical protein
MLHRRGLGRFGLRRRRGFAHWSGLLRRLVGFHGRRTRLKTKAVRLADHGVAADSTQFVRDLAGGQALFPHCLELVDTLVGPGQ